MVYSFGFMGGSFIASDSLKQKENFEIEELQTKKPKTKTIFSIPFQTI